MFAETDFGLVAEKTLDSTEKFLLWCVVTAGISAICAFVALVWQMRGAW